MTHSRIPRPQALAAAIFGAMLALTGCSPSKPPIRLSDVTQAPADYDLRGATIHWQDGFEIASLSLSPDSIRNELNARVGSTDRWFTLRPATRENALCRSFYYEITVPGLPTYTPGIVLADGTTLGGGMTIGGSEVRKERSRAGFAAPDSIAILDGGLICRVPVRPGLDEFFCRRPDLDNATSEARPFVHPGYALIRDAFWLWIPSKLAEEVSVRPWEPPPLQKGMSIFDEGESESAAKPRREAAPPPAPDPEPLDCSILADWPEAKDLEPKRTSIFAEEPPEAEEILRRVDPTLLAAGAFCLALNGDLDGAINLLDWATRELSPYQEGVYWITAQNYRALSALHLAREEPDSALHTARMSTFFTEGEATFDWLVQLPAPDDASPEAEFRRRYHQTLSRMMESLDRLRSSHE